MNCDAIFDKINTIFVNDSQYVVFPVENCFYGKDNDDNVVFILKSKTPKVPALQQKTKDLSFIFNKHCQMKVDNALETNIVHVLTCKNKDVEKVKAFIRLTKSFSNYDRNSDQYYLAKLFSAIASLFDKEKIVSELEVQGLFAELYTILYFHEKGIDLSKKWQSKNRMKFDFSLDEKKRIEIKSTLKAERIHHFKHDQLLNELYDIMIVSVLLRKSDVGISLNDLVQRIRVIFQDNFALILHIESIVTHLSDSLLNALKYDDIYTKNNIRFFDADSIPHFTEKTPDGVFNAEYDCDLSTTEHVTESDILNWIKENDNV